MKTACTLPSTQLLDDTTLAVMKAIAVGDSLGLPLEGLNKTQIQKRFDTPVRQLLAVQDVPFFSGEHPPGTISDDTYLSLASCQACKADTISMDRVAQALIEAYDFAVTHTPDSPHPRGWGWSVGDAILKLKQGVPWSEAGLSQNPNRGFGNGVLIRIAPLALYLWKKGTCLPLAPETHTIIRNFTAITHPTDAAYLASAVYVTALLYCLQHDRASFSRDAFVAESTAPLQWYECQADTPLYERLQSLNTQAHIDDIIMSCCDSENPSHVANSLPLVMAHACISMESFDTLYDLISLGEDADSNGSMFGALFASLHKHSDDYEHLFQNLIKRDWLLKQFKTSCS